MKCRYNHCRHASTEVDKDEAVKVGNKYYHPDCFREKELLNKIVETYMQYVDPNPVMVQLRNIINKIVFGDGVEPEFIIFAIQKSKIKHPPGLYYIVKDESLIKEWNAMKAKKEMSNMAFVASANYEEDKSFHYVPVKNKGFSRILG